jgi:hypothetical protein
MIAPPHPPASQDNPAERSARAPAAQLRWVADRLYGEIPSELETLVRRAARLGSVSDGAILLVASSRRRLGCSTLTIALGRAARVLGPVLIVDGTMGNSGNLWTDLVHPCVGLGWPDLAAGRAKLDDCLRWLDSEAGLAILPGHSVNGGHSVDAAALAPCRDWLRQTLDEFHLVVIDGGEATTSAVFWANAVDCAVLLRDQTISDPSNWSASWDALEAAGAHVLGLVDVEGNFPT